MYITEPTIATSIDNKEGTIFYMTKNTWSTKFVSLGNQNSFKSYFENKYGVMKMQYKIVDYYITYQRSIILLSTFSHIERCKEWTYLFCIYHIETQDYNGKIDYAKMTTSYGWMVGAFLYLMINTFAAHLPLKLHNEKHW